MVDMMHMGYVDEVLFGREVVERLPTLVSEWARLLECPPGTGKTMTAGVLAHELDLPLLSIRLDGCCQNISAKRGPSCESSLMQLSPSALSICSIADRVSTDTLIGALEERGSTTGG